MAPSVKQAVDEIRQAFVDHQITAEEEEQGGAIVIVHDIDIGDTYTPATTWVGCLITFQYPRADVYPHFIDGNVKRVDGKPLGGGFSSRTWQDRPAHQVSRRSNHRNPAVDTAAIKLVKVIEWIRSR